MTTPLLALPLYDLPRAMLRLDSMAGLIAAFAPDKELINVDRTTRLFYYRGVRYRDDLGGVGFEPDGSIVCPDDAISFVQWTPAGGVVQEAALDHLKFAIAEVTCAGGLITHYEDIRDMNLLTPPGMRWRSVWDAAANYIKGDVVKDQPGISGPGGFNLYIAKKASQGIEPPNTTYWEVVAYGLPDPATGLPGDIPAVNAEGTGYELVDPGMTGGAPLDVEEEGVLAEPSVSRLNFIGSAITAVGDGVGGVDVTVGTGSFIPVITNPQEFDAMVFDGTDWVNVPIGPLLTAMEDMMAGTKRTTVVQISTANTNRDGSGTLGSLYTAPAGGAKITKVVVKAQATSAAGAVRLFIYDGSNNRPYREFLVPAITVSATVAAFERDFVPVDGIHLENGWELRASTHNAETFTITTEGVDY